MAPKSGSAGRAGNSGKDKAGPTRKVIDTIKEATGASEDDVLVALEECGGDANEATARLIESEWGVPEGIDTPAALFQAR